MRDSGSGEHSRLKIDARLTACHIPDVTVFNFTLRRGLPIFEQVVVASIGAILRGEFAPGESFPSIRMIASDLKIHPNTAHKVIQHLLEQQWLESRPGLGTVVANRPRTRREDGLQLIQEDVDRLVAKALSIDLPLEDVMEEIKQQGSGATQVRRTS